MNDEALTALLQRVEIALTTCAAQQIELDAANSANRFLLEVLYANAFIGRRAECERLMADLLRAAQQSSTRAGPMPEETALELQARVAARIERFGTAVLRRLDADQFGR